VTTQKKIEPAFRKTVKLLDPATLLDDYEKSNSLFEQIIVKGAAR